MHSLKKKEKGEGKVINLIKFKLKAVKKKKKKPSKIETHQKIDTYYCRSAPAKIAMGVSEGGCNFLNTDVIYWELKLWLIATEVESLA